MFKLLLLKYAEMPINLDNSNICLDKFNEIKDINSLRL